MFKNTFTVLSALFLFCMASSSNGAITAGPEKSAVTMQVVGFNFLDRVSVAIDIRWRMKAAGKVYRHSFEDIWHKAWLFRTSSQKEWRKRHFEFEIALRKHIAAVKLIEKIAKEFVKISSVFPELAVEAKAWERYASGAKHSLRSINLDKYESIHLNF